jgi:hypothetical protein
MQDATGPNAAEAGAKTSLKARAVSELEKYAVVTAYFWLLFALFSLHKQLVLGHGINFWQQGFAIINALVFGKVVLIGDAFELAKGKDGQSLAGIALRKSLIFAILIVAFHVAEEMVQAWFKGKALAAVVPDLGGATALVAYAAIFFIVLVPFFAFQEAARVLGRGKVWDLFFGYGETRGLTRL